MLETILTVSYLVILLSLAVYGFHRSTLVYFYYKYKDRQPKPG